MFVERNNGVVTGLFTCRQAIEQEVLADDDPEVLAFWQAHAALFSAISRKQQDADGMRADLNSDAAYQQLAGATKDQVVAFVDLAATDLQGVRQLLRLAFRLLWAIAKRLF